MSGASWTARFSNVDRETTLVGGGLSVTLLVTLLVFLAAPALTIFPLAAFVACVVFGLVRYQEETAKVVMFLMTASTVLILGLITVYLILKSVPTFQIMGVDILTRTQQPMWAPGQQIYSLVPMMWGTFVTTILAMLIAAPLGVAGAFFISEIAPGWAREIIKPAIEMLAGIPSIVYGFIGFVVLIPYTNDKLQLSTYGSFFIVGLVVGVMALPTVVSVAEDAIASVPNSMKDGSLALGATEWQTIKSVTLPAAFSGISAAILLGVGRAVGETMAATVILAHSQALPKPLYDVFASTETLTTVIASQYGNASGTHLSALFAAGVVLFVTVLALSIGSQLIEAHMRKKLGGSQ